VTVPEEVQRGSVRLEIAASGGLLEVVTGALPYLIRYPYGCVEQTVSRFLPAVVVRQTLAEVGVDLADIRRLLQRKAAESARPPDDRAGLAVFDEARLQEVISAALRRLQKIQNANGGWGWFQGGPSDDLITAYVCYSLAEAVSAGLEVPAGIVGRAVKFLKNRISRRVATASVLGSEELETLAWIVFSVAELQGERCAGNGDVERALEILYDRRDGLSDYGRALLAMALARSGARQRARVVAENFENTAREDKDAGTVWWGGAGPHGRWYRNEVETTAMVLRALLRTAPEHRFVHMAADWLVRSRRGDRWFSTKQTALAIYALLEYARKTSQTDLDAALAVSVDGTPLGRVRLTKEGLFDPDATARLSAADLPAGRHEIRVRKAGRGDVYVSVMIRYLSRQDPIPASTGVVTVRRTYYLLEKVAEPAGRKRPDSQAAWRQADGRLTRIDLPAVRSGDVVRVVLEIRSDGDYDYIIVEDPLPAGCEYLSARSGHSQFEGLSASVEFKADRAAFLIWRLPRGTHRIWYDLRCVYPGRYRVMPARLYAMYQRYPAANSAGVRFVISRTGEGCAGAPAVRPAALPERSPRLPRWGIMADMLSEPEAR